MQEPKDLVLEQQMSAPSVERVALLSVHTCPLDQPGIGDSGGMNVYVRSVARRLAEMGVQVDVFSRWAGAAERVRTMDPGVRVIHLEAGPAQPVPKEELDRYLCEFLYSLLRFESEEKARLGISGPLYDVVHSHYWLSGWVGRLAAERWGVPLAHSFHTLGRVKNSTLAPADKPEPQARIVAEERIVATADRILAPTTDEAEDLIRTYGARADRVKVIAPGVDTALFVPGNKARAKKAIDASGRTVILFVGRLQPLKSPDLAVRALAELVAREPAVDPLLVIIGGPSGENGVTPNDLEKLAADLGVGDRVSVREPVPQQRLVTYYRAADVVIVPSRSESFGLVALEASACGIPVVATDVGGLRTTVRDGITGLLVPGSAPADFAHALGQILGDPARAASLGAAGARFARRFDWRIAARGLLGVYETAAREAD
jgi:D-inositol-3-phosphate glycosyltransferase